MSDGKKLVLDANIFQVYEGTVKFNDNEKRQFFVQRPSGVTVFGVDYDNNLILICEYRSFLNKTILKAPAGGIEQGEEPRVAAMREYEEETGYTSYEKDLEEITVFRMGGWLRWETYFFVAKNTKITENRKHFKDDSEKIDVVKIPLDGALEYIANSDYEIDPFLLYGIAQLIRSLK